MTDSALTNEIDKNLFLKKLSRELTIKKNPFDADYKELKSEKNPNTYGPYSPNVFPRKQLFTRNKNDGIQNNNTDLIPCANKMTSVN